MQAQFNTEKTGTGNVGNAAGAEGERVPVFENESDDFTESQGHDGQVVAAQAQDRKTQYDAGQGAEGGANRQHCPEPQAPMIIQQGIAVGAHGIKGHIPEVEQTCQADHDVQSQTQNDVHERRNHNIGLVHGEDEGKRDCTNGYEDQSRHVNSSVFLQALPQ